MFQRALLHALLTGLFCVGFALFVTWAAKYMELPSFLVMSFISGALGSLTAHAILRRRLRVERDTN